MPITSNMSNTFTMHSAEKIDFNPTDDLQSKNIQDAIEETLEKAANTAAFNFGFISEGRKFGIPNGYVLPITAGKECIDGKTVERAANNVSLNPRTAALIYDKDGLTDKLETADPVSFIDNNTIALWKPNGDAVCSNLAVGLSTLAVANDLTKSGTITKVDGRDGGYAAKGDGSTGYYTSANSTGFPIGTAEREINMLFTCNSITGYQSHAAYGANSSSCAFMPFSNGARLLIGFMNTDLDTGFDLEIGKTYLVTAQYDGTTAYCYVNGIPVGKLAIALNTTASSLWILQNYSAGWRSYSTIHFVEIRNKMRTLQTIAEIANELLFPVCYDAINEATGTLVGTLTSGGGLSAAFSGSNSKVITSCAESPTTTGTGNIGISWSKVSDIKIIKQVLITGSSDYGFDSTNSASTITLALQGTNNGGTNWDAIDNVSISDSAGLSVTLNNKTGISYSWIRVLISSTATGTNIGIARVMFITDSSRKSIRSLLPDKVILGYTETSSNGITLVNDADWAYGRREGATGGNRIVTMSYKPVIAASPASMQWTPPFGNGSKFCTNWRSAVDSSGLNDVQARDYYYSNGDIGVGLTIYSNGKIGAYCGSSTAFINGAWRTGGYLRPVFTLQEGDNV